MSLRGTGCHGGWGKEQGAFGRGWADWALGQNGEKGRTSGTAAVRAKGKVSGTLGSIP